MRVQLMRIQLPITVCDFFFSSRRRHTRWPRDWSSDVCSSDLDALHRQFIAKLTAEITPEQVNQVKDGMTYNVVPITYNRYTELLPELTDQQKVQIKSWLLEAREYAMDAGSSDQKHHIFNDYKGKINNYVSSQGYNLAEAEEKLENKNMGTR